MKWVRELEYTEETPLPRRMEWLFRSFRKLSQWSETLISHWTDTLGPENDLLPTKDDQWLGDASSPIGGLAVGPVTDDTDDLSIEGVVTHRGYAPGVPTARGLLLAGYGDELVRDLPDEPNLPVQIWGVPTMVTGPMGIEVAEDFPADRYLAVGPPSLALDGKYYAPVILGPEIIYSAQDTAQDTRDIDLDGAGTIVPVVSMTLANSYPVDVSTFVYRIRLAEESSQGRTADFTIRFFVNSAEVYTFDISLAGTAQTVSESLTLQSALAVNDVVEMRVDAVGTHVQSDPWVRGSVDASTITVSR